MPLHFSQPAFLLLALVAVPLSIVAWRALAAADRARRFTAVALRALLFALLAFTLAGPEFARRNNQVSVIALVDVSGSVRRFADLPPLAGAAAGEPKPTTIQWLRTWMREAARSRTDPRDRFGLVAFDGEAFAIAAPTTAQLIDDDLDVASVPGTSIADAILLGAAMMPPGTAGRLVLATDGNETDGGAIDAARSAAAGTGAGSPIPIDVLPISYAIEHDARLVRVEVPPSARPGQTVTVRMIVEASEPIAGRLVLRLEGAAVDLDTEAQGHHRRVELPAGRSVHLATVELRESPVNRFEAIFVPDDAALDELPDNNRSVAFTATPGRGRVLVVDAHATPGALADLAARTGLPMDRVSPAELPGDLLSLQNYDLIVLDDVPASAIERDRQELLARWVHDLGGGLVMTGGEHAFGAGGWNGSPLERVLPLELDPPRELRVPSAALVLVLDNSGSMNRPVGGARASQQEVANEAAARAVETLLADSLIGVVTFNSFASEYISLRPNDDPKGIAAKIRRINAGGGTNIAPALELATEMLRGVEAERKRVVCLSDGQSPKDDLEAIVRAMREENIRLSTIAVGDEADHETLRALAEIGEGEFYPVYNPTALPRVLVDSVQVVNKPLIKEVPFVAVVLPTGSSIAAGLDGAPRLDGLVVTAPRPDAQSAIELAHPEGEPLLARWQAGLGRVAAFTSDVGGPWSARWSGYAPATAFWTQLLRATARPATNHEAELFTRLVDDRLELVLEATDSEGKFIDYLQVDGTLYPPSGKPQEVRLRQTAPGRYETEVAARDAGNYIVALNPRRGSRQLAPVFGGASRSTGEEFRRTTSDLALLESIVETTGGRRLNTADPREVDLFDRAGLEASITLLDTWRPLLFAVLALFLIDAASRRIAWSSASVRAAWARAIERVTPARVKGAEAAATLAGLRGVADRAGERTAPHEEVFAAAWRAPDDDRTPAAPPKPAQPEPQTIESVLDAFTGRTTPAAEPRRDRDAASPRPEETGEPADTTSSLLEAKRRARRRFDPGVGGHDSDRG